MNIPVRISKTLFRKGEVPLERNILGGINMISEMSLWFRKNGSTLEQFVDNSYFYILLEHFSTWNLIKETLSSFMWGKVLFIVGRN
jgi:hypothetical protein